MQPEVSFGIEKQMNYEAWKTSIMEKVNKLEKTRLMTVTSS